MKDNPRILDETMVDETIREWHMGGFGLFCTLAQALGWSQEEYEHWVKTNELPEQ